MLIIIIFITCFVFALLAKRHIQKIIEKHRIEDGIVDAQETKDVLDEKDSIKQAEAIIKRRKLYSRTLKISVASLIIVALAIVAGVFFLDTYKASAATFNNETSKEYWNTLPGFEHYDDLYAKYVDTEDINHPSYVSPYTNPNASIYKKISQARYREELDALIDPYKDELDKATDPVRKQELQSIIDEAKLYESKLLRWKDYKTEVALGYKLVAKEGDYEFWLHMGLTTFKVVDKSDPSNIVEWHSNPQTYDVGKETSQKDILKIWYSKTGSNKVSLGTYEYSTSTIFRESTKDVNPNYAIKQFTKTDENGKEVSVIQVWYKLEERGINYTYFPKYIRPETVDGVVETDEKGNEINVIQEGLVHVNARLAAEGVEYEPGKVIENIKTTKDKNGVTYYSKLFNPSSGLYRKVLVTNPNNLFGEDYYEFSGSLEKMSDIQLNTVYMMYTHCGFTEGMLAEENEYYQEISNSKGLDIKVSNTLPSDVSFSVGVQYELTSDGLNVSIPGNSISENGENLVVYIDLLEYFTAAPKTEEGYTIIPDGSGAVLNHNNGKTAYNLYSKRLYTTDLSMTQEVKQTSTEDIMLPMYAVVNTTSNAGVIADVIEGAAQMELYADVSGRGTDTFNRNYFRIYYHESQVVKVSSVMQPIDKYNNLFMNNDITVTYRFFGKDVVKDGYSGVAKKYRDLLVERYDMQDKKDETDDLVIDIDVLGAYDFDTNFLGIVYTDKETLTTFEQLKTMIKDIEKVNYHSINVFYKGWRKETLLNSTFKKMSTYKDLGDISELRDIEQMDGVTVYPYINFGQVNKYQESFGSYHYNTRNVIGEIITIYPYDLQSNLWNKKATKINIVSPRYYVAFAQSLADSYANLFNVGDNDEVLANISLDSIGSVLTGDYQKNQEMFKINAVYEQIEALEIIKNAGIDSINLYRPYDYAFPYVTNAKEIPYQATQYEILDYSIPFYQLVVNGLFDYSGESINANSEDGTDQHILRILETGSNASFTFTYEGSEVLLTTDYNQYYYTQYSEWLEDVKYVYDEVSSTGIAGCQLVKHEYISEGICRVTYEKTVVENDVEKLVQVQILINYSRVQYTDLETGISVPAKSFKVL